MRVRNVGRSFSGAIDDPDPTEDPDAPEECGPGQIFDGVSCVEKGWATSRIDTSSSTIPSVPITPIVLPPVQNSNSSQNYGPQPSFIDAYKVPLILLGVGAAIFGVAVYASK